jgi:transcription-repair coupling factor (superfamily II helicase)
MKAGIAGMSIGTYPPSLQAMLIAEEFLALRKNILWLVESDEDMYRAKVDLACFIPQNSVLCFLAPDVRPYQGDSPSKEVTAARIEVLVKLVDGGPYIVIAPINAVLPYTLPRHALKDAVMILNLRAELNREEFSMNLIRMGYTREPLVDDVGQFSMRGFVMDIFSPGMDEPVRLDMFGDMIEEIKVFSLSSQRSKKSAQTKGHPSCTVMPVSEVLLTPDNIKTARPRLRRLKGENLSALIEDIEQGVMAPGIEAYLPVFYEETATIFDYMGRDFILIGPDEEGLKTAWESFYSKYIRAYDKAADPACMLHPGDLMIAEKAFVDSATVPGHILTSITGGTSGFSWHDFRTGGAPEKAPERLAGLAAEGYTVFLTAGSAMLAEKVEYALMTRGADTKRFERPLFDLHRRPGIFINENQLSSGFVLPEKWLAVIPAEEAFGVKRQRKPARRQAIVNPFTQLEVGDAVVHRDNGIGIFKGVERLTLDGITSDFVVLEYVGGDKLYLPVYRLAMIQRYVGDTDALTIDRLGGTRWFRVTEKARESARKLAAELLQIYAKRESSHGFSYDVDTEQVRAFEDDFPYDETDDQQKAIEDVYADMASSRPMDRLVCGDVGYGKTEVAMRAAFVAAMSGKQTAILVPTTLLVRQHLSNFRERFERWPLRIEALSGFATSQQNENVMKAIETGAADILIGTHALISDNVRFKDLGLLIVDEEHRFGVKDKERIKSKRAELDILTLTATPIPRTLNMSLSGIRDLSIIETPPAERKSIDTEISRFDDEAIVNAIDRELARGGQVFFVHNIVANIDYMADYIRRICPAARIGVAHGQMPKRELEKVMEQFLDRRINVLVSSSIIGSGIDIGNANTIIINRADKFGMADLYQLRGRVGRSKLKGHALLLIPETGRVTKDARKRLSAIKEYESLGAGFQMAMRDMEIRGVGDILGHNQWGHVTAIGFELYQEMLAEAVSLLQGKTVTPGLDPEIKLGIDAYIPEDYCPEEHLRLGLYKKLATVSPEDIPGVMDELIDMYGPVPGPVRALLFIAETRGMMKRLRIRKLELAENFLKLYFSSDTVVNIHDLIDLVTEKQGRLTKEGMAGITIKDIREIHGILERLIQKTAAL